MIGFKAIATSAMYVALAIAPARTFAQATSLVHAHAHNDYEHARPLMDALERGFNSIEADVYLVDGRLLVAHSRDSVHAERTLESLYLAPLRNYTRAHNGRAILGAEPLVLLIDVKSDSNETLDAIEKELSRYDDIFTHIAGGTRTDRPVTAVISGHRAIGRLTSDESRYSALDGRPGEIARTPRPSAKVMPLVSESWDRFSKWDGEGNAPAGLIDAIRRFTSLAHADGRKTRIWGAPDTPAIWRFFLDNGVDILNADDLGALQRFLTAMR